MYQMCWLSQSVFIFLNMLMVDLQTSACANSGRRPSPATALQTFNRCFWYHLVKQGLHSDTNFILCHNIPLWTCCACLGLCWTWPPLACRRLSNHARWLPVSLVLIQSSSICLTGRCRYHDCLVSLIPHLLLYSALFSHAPSPLCNLHLHRSSTLSARVRFLRQQR